jgi:plasmid stabilization system protein ParE
MRDVLFHRLAVRELREALKWYSERSGAAHLRFRAALFEAVQRIADNPEAQAQLIAQYRFVRPRRFPYLLIYEIRSDRSAFVVAVAHSSRRSGYWRRRSAPEH